MQNRHPKLLIILGLIALLSLVAWSVVQAQPRSVSGSTPSVHRISTNHAIAAGGEPDTPGVKDSTKVPRRCEPSMESDSSFWARGLLMRLFQIRWLGL